MRLNDWFIWNGVRCTELGIHVLKQPALIRPPERATFTSVPGRSGTLTTLEGKDVYDDFIVSAECMIRETSNLPVISQYLKGDGKVTFANRQGGFYVARIVNQISFDKILRGNPHHSFIVNFRCQPFFYLSNVQDLTITQSGLLVQNQGNVFAEPVVKVTLTSDAEIVMGGSYFELAGITGTVTIDTPLMETYMDYESYNQNMRGDYPKLLAGENIVSWTGGVSQIVMTPNWRML